MKGFFEDIENLTERNDDFRHVYGAPNHLDQLVQVTKAEALVSKETFAGATTE